MNAKSYGNVNSNKLIAKYFLREPTGFRAPSGMHVKVTSDCCASVAVAQLLHSVSKGMIVSTKLLSGEKSIETRSYGSDRYDTVCRCDPPQEKTVAMKRYGTVCQPRVRARSMRRCPQFCNVFLFFPIKALF